jgi:hypothetical protein
MRSGRILLAAAGFVYALFAAGCFRLAVEHGYERAVSVGEGSFVLLGAVGFFVAERASRGRDACDAASCRLVSGDSLELRAALSVRLARRAVHRLRGLRPRRPRAHAADVAAVIRCCLSEKNGAEAGSGLQGRRASCRLENPDAPRVRAEGTRREHRPGHRRARVVIRLRGILASCAAFVPAASLLCPPFPVRRSMVRRGSTVRVRQRASGFNQTPEPLRTSRATKAPG